MPPSQSLAAPIRVLVVGVKWPPETFLARLFRGLLSDGVHVTVATRTRPDDTWLREPGFAWLRAPGWSGSSLQRAGTAAALVLRGLVRQPAELGRLAAYTRRSLGVAGIRTAYRHLPFVGGWWDVVYFPWNDGAVVHAPLVDAGMPVVISCRGGQVNVAPHDPRRGGAVDGLRWGFAKATAVHCVSEAILREAERYGLDPAKAEVIRPAVDPAFFAPASVGADRDGFTMVTTGSLIWRKGVEYTLTAVRRLVDMGVDARLQIVGTGPELDRARYTVHDLGLAGHVELLGALPPEGVRDRLQQADAFVLCSLSEGVSNAVLEAMSCGLPVVTTDCGGMREAVEDGIEGFVVPPREPAATAAALHQLAVDPTLRAAMGAAARARVLRQFTLAGQVAAFGALLRRAAAAGPHAAASRSPEAVAIRHPASGSSPLAPEIT